MLDSAIAFAAIAHAGQTRKYDGLPYITHPIEVMCILQGKASGPITVEQKIAAILHDVVEDTTVTCSQIQNRFSKDIAMLVNELTDRFVDPAQGNRAVRKEKERERLAKISPYSQSVKYADLISNTHSIAKHDPGFARKYLEEKRLLLEVMTDGDHGLYRAAHESLQMGQQMLLDHHLGAKQ